MTLKSHFLTVFQKFCIFRELNFGSFFIIFIQKMFTKMKVNPLVVIVIYKKKRNDKYILKKCSNRKSEWRKRGPVRLLTNLVYLPPSSRFAASLNRVGHPRAAANDASYMRRFSKFYFIFKILIKCTVSEFRAILPWFSALFFSARNIEKIV